MKLTGALVVALALVVGVVRQFTHCKTGSMVAAGAGASHVTTAAAVTPAQPMRCYWTARAEIGSPCRSPPPACCSSSAGARRPAAPWRS